MGATIVFFSIILVFGIILIVNIFYKRRKIETFMKIDFLNKELNEHNVKIFRSSKKYFYITDVPDFPEIIEGNKANFDYRETLKEYYQWEKVIAVFNFVLIPIFFILILMLVFKYPSDLVEIIRNDGSN